MSPSTETKPTVFIAHSNLDLADARLIRNIFEEREHDALLLKLSQQMSNDYLEDLLRREIQARDWFVVVVSENSRKSGWVTFEQKYARARNKPIYYIELEKCRRLEGAMRQDCLKVEVSSISRAIRVFLSYSRTDEPVARKLRMDLSTRGYEVWDFEDQELRPGMTWVDSMRAGIDWTLEKGALIVLLSSYSVESRFVRDELHYALSRRGRVIPCIIQPPPARAFMEIEDLQYVDLSRSYEQGFRVLLTALSAVRSAVSR